MRTDRGRFREQVRFARLFQKLAQGPALRAAGASLSSYSSTPNGSGVRVHLLLEATTAVSQPDFIMPLLSNLSGIRPETVE